MQTQYQTITMDQGGGLRKDHQIVAVGQQLFQNLLGGNKHQSKPKMAHLLVML